MEDKELQEARNCVKEANLFEENMTVDEIKQTYRMIQMSKESKEKDEQKRSSDPFTFETESDNSKSVEQDINSLVEELCSPSTLSLGKKEVSEASEESNKKSNKLNGNLNMVDATKIKFGYLDMPPMSKIDYKLVEHQSKFVLIQHTDEFCNADFATQVKMLASHWSKPSKAEAGRHTKRKCYATSDDDSNDVNTTPKKSKASDQEWQCNISNNNNNNVNIESKVKSPTKKSKSTPAKDIEQESKNGNDGKNLDYIPTLTPLEMEEEPMDQQQPDVLENLDSKSQLIRQLKMMNLNQSVRLMKSR
ncbi:unnamed protein product [Callosobruchus maculatus]|uniref:Uncharacterized protein n=1 Tax=Callosobruchus maculatus TaxID=64391 RepID=A0A653C7D7_CALMS|nr:unnamed protein product [Callosobruchus maculatus]